MLKHFFLILTFILTACTSPDGASSGSTGDSGTSSSSDTSTQATTESQLQGSWKRVGQYCGSTYSTGLAEQHVAFSATQMQLSLKFVCDNTVHVAQYYDARYDHDDVDVEMTSAASGSCPMTYASSGSPGWTTYTANILNDSGSLTLELTIGTCAGGVAKKDVYQKE